MLSPSHPIRYNASIKIRSLHRNISDRFRQTNFAKDKINAQFGNLVVSNRSPIFRKLRGVSQTLQANKKQNLALAIPRLQGLVIRSGQTFSFWHLVGNPSPARGFLPGLIIKGGNPDVGIGGGLCQLSNSIFWCALHTGLSVRERHRHSYDIFPDDRRSVPFGLGAAVAWGVKDLRFENVSESDYQLICALDGDDLLVELRSKGPTPNEYVIREQNSEFYKRADGRIFRRNQVFRTNRATNHDELLFANDFECRYPIDDSLIATRD